MKIKRLIKKILPEFILRGYHLGLAWLAACYYKFPARRLKIIGITGTKGKTTTTELVNAILETAGHKTAIASTLRFKIGDQSNRNLMKMTMPGRFFLQKFLREASDAEVDYVIVEMTSEGAKMFRHKFIYLDALIFTGITPEHIESHGSYANYLAAKLSIAKMLEKSDKHPTTLVANQDSNDIDQFLAVKAGHHIKFGQDTGKPCTITDHGIEFSFQGEVIRSRLIGSFNLYNLLAASSLAYSLGIKPKVIKQAIENFPGVPGRMEHVFASRPNARAKQKFDVIVDYAHTPESLEKVYKTYPNRPKICVLGGTGGGRDKWKREVMGSIADTHCQEIILTDEDPYDEDPMKIVEDISRGISHTSVTTIMDRRQAIREAIKKAGELNQAVVFITGKGTDPFIVGPNDTKTPWSDADIAREELDEVLG